MAKKERFFIVALSIIIGLVFNAEAASRVAVRSAPGATTTRRSIAASKAVTQPVAEEVKEPTETVEEPVITNRSSEFEVMVSSVIESASEDNSFAEQIRKQREALAAADATASAQSTQRDALNKNNNSCDSDLRKCMMKKCGKDLTKCALDGATIFGDKLNACRRDTECTGEEFRLFGTEIQADRDMNVRLASFDGVINCGNQYNACIVNECGTTYNKCLGKERADAAIQKCSTIAKECTESDSGLANRFGSAIGKLRENAEAEVKKDEERMYVLRESMSSACKKIGAMFDERSFDCVFTVNFFAGENQTTPMASRKRYAGDTFVCMQEWFGINATTYKENAYRETRAQTGASSAMLGAGVGTAVGLVASGAVGRALNTQKAKKDLKTECESQGGNLKNGKCVDKKTGREIVATSDNNNNDASEEPVYTPEGSDEKPAEEKVEKTKASEDKNTENKDKIDTTIDEFNKGGKDTLAKIDKSLDDNGLAKVKWKAAAEQNMSLTKNETK